MLRALVRLGLAVAAVVTVTFPLVAFQAGRDGFSFALLPSLKLGGAILAIGLVTLAVHALWSRSPVH